jgi:hypothetical protein
MPESVIAAFCRSHNSTIWHIADAKLTGLARPSLFRSYLLEMHSARSGSRRRFPDLLPYIAF